MRFIERPYCERLGTPFAQELGRSGLISPEAMADPPVFGRARAVVRYDDGPARRLVHRLNTATGWNSPGPWAPGWCVPGWSFLARPTSSCPCRYTGSG